MDGWTDGWTDDGWMDGWMGGWVGGWVDGWMGGCFQTTLKERPCNLFCFYVGCSGPPAYSHTASFCFFSRGRHRQIPRKNARIYLNTCTCARTHTHTHDNSQYMCNYLRVGSCIYILTYAFVPIYTCMYVPISGHGDLLRA